VFNRTIFEGSTATRESRPGSVLKLKIHKGTDRQL